MDITPDSGTRHSLRLFSDDNETAFCVACQKRVNTQRNGFRPPTRYNPEGVQIYRCENFIRGYRARKASGTDAPKPRRGRPRKNAPDVGAGAAMSQEEFNQITQERREASRNYCSGCNVSWKADVLWPTTIGHGRMLDGIFCPSCRQLIHDSRDNPDTLYRIATLIKSTLTKEPINHDDLSKPDLSTLAAQERADGQDGTEEPRSVHIGFFADKAPLRILAREAAGDDPRTPARQAD